MKVLKKCWKERKKERIKSWNINKIRQRDIEKGFEMSKETNRQNTQ